MIEVESTISPDSPFSAWNTYSDSQKLAFVTANLLTLSRPVISGLLSNRGLEETHEWSWGDAVLATLSAATDAEGNIVRHFGVVTEAGELFDRLADRIATYSLEAVLTKREEMPVSVLLVNLLRSVGIIGVRQYVRRNTTGRPDFTSKPTKVSAFIRQASNIVTVSPVGRKYPAFRTATQITSAIAGIATGIMDARKLIQQVE